MATTKLSSFETVFHFTLNVMDLNSKCVYSPETELSNLKWKLEFAKKSINGDKKTEALAVHLVSVFDEESKKWSCEAQATFKLLQKDGQADNCVVKYLTGRVFDKENASHGVDDFIKWRDLLQQHVQGNQAKFKVEISTWPLKSRREPCNDLNAVSTEFLLTIESVSKLEECVSREVVLHGIRWTVKCEKEEDHLSIYLYGDKNDMDANWFYTAHFRFILSSFESSVMPITKETIKIFDIDTTRWGWSKLLEWSEFVDEKKKYVSNDKAKLFVTIEVEPEPMWKIQRYTPIDASPSLKCCICLDKFESGNMFSVKCGHLFCKPCFDELIARRKVCPTCQTQIKTTELHPIFF